MPTKSNYYPDDEEAASAPGAGEDPSDQPPENPEEDEAETFLVNNSAFGAEPQIGQTYTVKVVAMHDGQAECSVESEAAPKEEAGAMGNSRPELPGGMGGAPGME